MDTRAARNDQWDALRLFLFLMLASDAFFIGIHLVHISSSTLLQDALYSIETDGSFSEWFQYVKEGWIALLCFTLWKRTKSVFYVGWALLFGYFLLDDSMSIHEAGGESISRHLHIPPSFGLRPQDIGELIVSAVVGSILLSTIALTYLRAPLNEKNVSRDFFFLVLTIVAFGVGVDTFHSFISNYTSHRWIKLTLGMLEDGGEMIAMSWSCWYAIDLCVRNGVAAPTRVWRRLMDGVSSAWSGQPIAHEPISATPLTSR